MQVVAHDISKRVVAVVFLEGRIGRRNVTKETASLLRGMLYLGRKKEVPNPDGLNQHMEVECQSDIQPTTAEIVAKETGVSPRTVSRDAKFAAAAEKLGI